MLQPVYKEGGLPCSMQCIDSFYLVFYYKGMLGKVMMQRTQQMSAFPLLPWKTSQLNAARA